MIERREFIAGLGGAAVWPLVAHSQQPSVRVVGFLGAPAAAPYAQFAGAVRQGLRESGFVEGQNLTIEYRWAEGHYDRLPAMATDLVRQHVALIIPIGGAPATIAAKAATSTIPIVFNMTADPVALGVVASLNRPGGNVTGVAIMGVELEPKRLELLREVTLKPTLIGLLINPTNPQAQGQSREFESAAERIGQQVRVVKASTEGDVRVAFAKLAEQNVGALLLGQDPFFASQPELLVAMAERYRIPTISPWQEHTTAGALMSYGANLGEAYRQTGVYAARVLRGDKPADLPVQEATKFDLIINMKTAKAFGLAVPNAVLVSADEVIE
jgi:putative tryptophan/tyrosine transport system substrate-binding protein